MLRASFAQKLKDHVAPIENVSMALRHQTVVTTEHFYARVRTDRAWDALEEPWSNRKSASNGSENQEPCALGKVI